MPEFQIRTMTRKEVDWAVDMAAREGWNPGLHDANAFHAQDPDGFIIGLLDGSPIGCISAVSYGGLFGFIGFYIVAKTHRGKGYGIQLWNAAMERLKGQVIGLDGVFEQQDNYRKSGFQFEYSNIRFEFMNTKPSARLTKVSLTSINSIALPELVEYERELFPAPRERFLGKWFEQSGAYSLVARDNNVIRGYGMIRPCRTGFKIGPLFADNAELAEELFCALCAEVDAGEPIYLDVPETNAAGLALAKRYDMKRVFGTARMYTGTSPALDGNRIFGVTTFELG